MAIEGLRQEVIAPAPKVTIGDRAEVSVKALRMLGLAEDRDQALESISADYQSLTDLNIPGRPYVDIPYSTFSTAYLVYAIDANTDGPDTHVYDNFWIPGKKSGSYTDEQLAQSSGQTTQARLALHSNHDQEPLLHFAGQPFDGKYAEKGPRTQLESVERAKKAFEAEHPDRTMQALGHRAFLLISLEQRIKGEPLPIKWGYMRDANLPRAKVYGPRTEPQGGWLVGGVYSNDGKLVLSTSYGGAYSDKGVGLSVGLKEA